MEIILSAISFLLILTIGLIVAYKKDKKYLQKYEDKKTTSNSIFISHRINGRMFVLIDKNTHVQYLHVYRNHELGDGGGNAITPLYQANGEVCVGENVSTNRFSFNELDECMEIITDNETQVQYLQVYRNKLYGGGVALTPLLNADGKFNTKYYRRVFFSWILKTITEHK